MLTRRLVLGGLVAAPAVVKFENIMRVYSLPERYATVWGVGHNLEVIEHVVWSKENALMFAKRQLYNFREVTDVIYEFDMPPIPDPVQSHWTQRQSVQDPLSVLGKSPVVQEDGFTDIVTFRSMNAWRESLRPDLGGRSSDEWIQNEIRLRDEAGLGPLAWYPGAGLVKIPVT